MSTAAPTATPPATAPSAQEPRRSRRVLMVLFALLVVGGAGAGAAVVLLGGGSADAAVAEEAPPSEPAADGPVVEVGTLTTNLAGSTRFARVGVALVLTADADPAAVEARVAMVKDAAISEIGSRDAARLQAPGGTEELRGGLTERIVALFPDGEVSRVVLTELLIQ